MKEQILEIEKYAKENNIKINFIKVDGELKYQAKRQDEQGDD